MISLHFGRLEANSVLTHSRHLVSGLEKRQTGCGNGMENTECQMVLKEELSSQKMKTNWQMGEFKLH